MSIILCLKCEKSFCKLSQYCDLISAFHLLYWNCLLGRWWWLLVLYFLELLAAFLLYVHTHISNTHNIYIYIYIAKILSYTIYSKNTSFPEFWPLSDPQSLVQLVYPVLASYTLNSVVMDMTAVTGLDLLLPGAHVPLLMEDGHLPELV